MWPLETRYLRDICSCLHWPLHDARLMQVAGWVVRAVVISMASLPVGVTAATFAAAATANDTALGDELTKLPWAVVVLPCGSAA